MAIVLQTMDADLYGINTESKHYWPHEVDLFHTAYGGTLRVVKKQKGMEEHGIGKGQGEVGKREGEWKRRGIVAI